jgi:hypothetical protein
VPARDRSAQRPPAAVRPGAQLFEHDLGENAAIAGAGILEADGRPTGLVRVVVFRS